MTILIILSAIFTGAYLVLMLLYYTGWIATKEFAIKDFQPKTKVAIIISARNEEKNILNVVQDILAQNYPKDLMEIFVMDDFSSDKTVDVLKSISDSRLKIIQLKNEVSDENNSSKKKAIEIAISKTQADLIVTTDADCRMKPEWLKNLVAAHELHGKQFIMGPVKYDKAIVEKNLRDSSLPLRGRDRDGAETFFEQMQTLDFFGYTGIACGSLFWRMPALCNGANLAYSRKLFYELNGFEGNEKIASGDDMFLMTKAFQKNPSSVFYLKSAEATVSTFASVTWKEFLQQRIRWGSKSKHYTDFKITASLAVVFLFYLLIIIATILSTANCQLLTVALFMFLSKCLIDAIFLGSVANFFNRRKLLLIFLPAQLFHISYVLVAGLLSQLKTYNWKNRINR